MRKNNRFLILEYMIRSLHGRPRHLIWLLLVMVILAFLSSPSASSAHSRLVGTIPKAGEILDTPPEQVTAWFSEELDSNQSTIQVFGPDERRVDTGNGGVDLNDLEHKHLLANLPQTLSTGTYTVYWTAASAEDGDLTEGRFTFSLNTKSGGQARPNAALKKTNIFLSITIAVTAILVISAVGYVGWKRFTHRKQT